MRQLAILAGLLLALLLAGCSQAPRDPGSVELAAGTGGILGYVRENAAHQPGVANASVIVEPGGFVATTDADGNVVVRDVPPGHYRATAWLAGYEGSPKEFDVAAGNYTEFWIVMDKL